MELKLYFHTAFCEIQGHSGMHINGTLLKARHTHTFLIFQHRASSLNKIIQLFGGFFWLMCSDIHKSSSSKAAEQKKSEIIHLSKLHIHKTLMLGVGK